MSKPTFLKVITGIVLIFFTIITYASAQVAVDYHAISKIIITENTGGMLGGSLTTNEVVRRKDKWIVLETEDARSWIRNDDFFSKKHPAFSHKGTHVFEKELNEQTVKNLLVALKNPPVKFTPGITGITAAYLKENAGISVWDLRSAFSQQLGDETFYRGIVLPKDKIATIRKEGLSSQFFFQGRDEKKLRRILDPGLIKDGATSSTGITDEIQTRLSGNTDNSTLLSFTKIPEVTAATIFGPTRAIPDGSFHLFRVKVPAIDAIKMTGIFDYISERMPNDLFTLTKPSGEKFTVPYKDPNFEVFIQHVDAKAIEDVDSTQALPPRWETVRDPNATKDR